MNRILAIIIFFFASGAVDAQHSQKIESLDSFFAGIPLKQPYDKWVKYIVEDSTLGIDSARSRGLYSSYKAARPNHFPFPDSIPVKILVQTGLTINPPKRLPTDTIRVVLIEGVFEDSKKGNQESISYATALISMLKPYYKMHDKIDFIGGTFVYFWRGINWNFPDIELEQAYYEEGKFYYVLLRCEFSAHSNYKLKTR